MPKRRTTTKETINRDEPHCSAPDCPAEAFRFCGFCRRYFCVLHSCEHLTEVQFDDFENRNNDQTDSIQEAEPGQQPENTAAGSKHWLSNASIIAGLDDGKLRDAIRRHKSLLRLLEDEWTARQLSGNCRRPVRHDVASGLKETGRDNNRRVPTRKRRSKQTAIEIVLDALRSGVLTIDEAKNQHRRFYRAERNLQQEEGEE